MEPGEKCKSIIEGLAEIRVKSNKVFYNPVQEFNRDLSIAVLSTYVKEYKEQKIGKTKHLKDCELHDVPFTILEALSATGLRSIRYAKEIPNITKVIANDLSAQAVDTIKENITYNSVGNLVDASHDDACMLMYKHKNPRMRFAAIDLDPYGCPSIFLDAAVQSVQDYGILCVTATDMAVLAGNSPETCYVKYGAVSLKTKCCHEMALRILLQSIEHHANRYSRYIEPLLSISADFYIRVFVRVNTGAQQCKKTTSKLSMVYQCVGCDTITLQPLGATKPNPSERNPGQLKFCLPAAPSVGELCLHCNQRHRLGGPIWTAPIHNMPFVTRVLEYVTENPHLFGTAKRIAGVLSMVREELPDVPLYHILDKLFGRVHIQTMPILIMRSAILNAGYRVSFSHASKLSIKTDAPARLVWDIIRTWEKQFPASANKIESDLVARYILSQEIQSKVDLSEREDANPQSRRSGALRFQFNPSRHWGPGTRATINDGEEKMSKAKRNQNKNSKKNTEKRDHSPQSGDEARKKLHSDDHP
ncbi:probable tRNA (guanine(26)-N(2))-dimethyltransferase isoform X2 [Leptidea sinapis]|nr:probable tRNA (guanine(26)-N(2))-dimethyltransferase isoform X2 [Leptidea sinapis]XP_050664763.1 probable tRNA (guanine(26)-N(2))-dimethyltransferase isoform X2 [Leptidea sinapis]